MTLHIFVRLNVNREFIGQGLANLTAAFFSGYPVSGSFTRSAVNFRSGARFGKAGRMTATWSVPTVRPLPDASSRF
jgi:SulP family sulfate permease